MRDNLSQKQFGTHLNKGKPNFCLGTKYFEKNMAISAKLMVDLLKVKHTQYSYMMHGQYGWYLSGLEPQKDCISIGSKLPMATTEGLHHNILPRQREPLGDPNMNGADSSLKPCSNIL